MSLSPVINHFLKPHERAGKSVCSDHHEALFITFFLAQSSKSGKVAACTRDATYELQMKYGEQ